MRTNLYAFILAVLILAGAAIGSTVFITNQVNDVLDSVGSFTEHIDNATGKFDKILAALETEKVTGVTRKIVNDANLVNVDKYTFINGATTGGVKTSYDEDGVLTFDGKSTAVTSVALGERVILEKGYYTICVQADAPARTNCSIVLKTFDSEGKLTDFVRTSFASPLTFYCEDLRYVQILINIGYGEPFNNYEVMPVIVPGEKMQSFFIDETVPFT